MTKLAAALVFFALALVSTTALADDVECWRDPGPPPVHRCRPIEVRGRQPDAFVLLNRTADRYEARPLERRMAPEILRTVRRNPF